MMFRRIAITCALGLAVSAAHGSLLVAEDFTHLDGNLVGQTPTPGPGGTWAAHSAAGTLPVQVSSGVAVLQQGSGAREDVNTPLNFALGAGQTVYAAFDLVNLNDSADVYFAHFRKTDGVFSNRIFVTPATQGGDYTLGFGNGATPDVKWGNDLDYGATYRVVMSYAYDTGAAKLWVDPVDETSTSISFDVFRAADDISQFALRQATGPSGLPVPASTQWVDNLGVATQFDQALYMVPEPGMLLLLGLGAAMFRRRR